MRIDAIDSQQLARYGIHFAAGNTVFLEGDDSQDLYILLSGELEILKGGRKIADLTKPGSLFGEMSFLMGACRTATIRAVTEVEAICIPRGDIDNFLAEFPDAAAEISRALAERLDESNRILLGLQEFDDQIPDALILTDHDGRILCWNAAAEMLYGREWQEMKNRPVIQIYEDPEAYGDFLNEARKNIAVREKVLTVRHPETGIRHASTSMKLLYDGRNEYQGALSLARDVTHVRNLEKRYRFIRNWLALPLVLVGLLAVLLMIAAPGLLESDRVMHARAQELVKLVNNDYLGLKQELSSAEEEMAAGILHNFITARRSRPGPYAGLVLLDNGYAVTEAVAMAPGHDARKAAGVTYAGVTFPEAKATCGHILTLYRSDPVTGEGRKGLEIAFRLHPRNPSGGWIIFQMNSTFLADQYELDADKLQVLANQIPAL